MKTKRTKKMPETKTVLVLRTCKEDLTSHGGFQWPSSGPVSAPDWNPEPICGYGLHGFLKGEGDGTLADWSETAKWLVVEVIESEIVKLGDAKVKFPRGTVLYAGDQLTATNMIAEAYPNAAVVGGCKTAGTRGTATAGEKGIITIAWWDSKNDRCRLVLGYVGEDGIKPHTKYRLNNEHKFVEVAP